MSQLDERLAENRAALDDLIRAAEEAEAVWTTPRAPKKWSPSQLVEHVARSYDSGADAVAGQPSSLPTLPGFLRPLARALLFNRVLAMRGFPKARTNKAMDPLSGPETPGAGRDRLIAACESFERACRTKAEAGDEMATPTFGSVRIADYVLFMEQHTRHHLAQMPQV